jgi:uncharacterized protein (DUF2252 family)
MATVEELAKDPDARSQRIVDVLVEAFSELIEHDPRAFRRKFRKMAADPFAFYRGTAPLFYADVDQLEDPYADKRTSRVWIQGDLHAENYGTYMSSDGVLVFDVNDFDEAYLGHFTWDLRRMAASVSLLGFAKALSDETIRTANEAYATSYIEQVRAFAEGDDDEEFRLTLANTEGALRETLVGARMNTRIAQLEGQTHVDGDDRRFRGDDGMRHLGADEQGEVHAAFREYLETIPERKRQQSVSYTVKDIVGHSGFGIGSAGLPAYSLLIEGRTEALENDVILSMKQGNVAAPSRVVDDAKITKAFRHHGHRTAVSQRALQAHADPWLGWCELGGNGYVVAEVSPYANDLDWDAVSEPSEVTPLVEALGRATAKVHCVSDSGSDQTLVDFETEDAIAKAVGEDTRAFATHIADFGEAYGRVVRADFGRFVDAFRSGAIPGLPAD